MVTGEKAHQKIFYAVFAHINRDIPEPSPYPFLSMSSSKMTTIPAPINCITMMTMVAMGISEGIPYVPDQIATTASPKQKIIAKIPSRPYASFSSSFELILNSPKALRIWVIHPAEMIGEMPNYMRVPLREAMITLAQ